MAETLNKDELLGKALGTKLPVSPVAEAVSLKASEQVAAPVDFSAAKADKPLPVKEDYMAAVKPDIEALGQAEEEKLKFAGLEKIDTAKREAAKQTALGESAAKQRQDILDDPSRAEYKRALEDKAKPFIPHEENAQDLMMLFGLLNVVGFAIGAGGKEYSQAAMSAMNGMLEGHQKGRDDLYKKEKSIFETNQKQLDSRIKQLLAFMQDSELLTNMDKTARDQAIQGKFLEDGATFLTEYYKKNGYGKTVETLKEMVKASSKAAELVTKETQRAADQDFTLRLDAQKARENREQQRDKVLAQYDLASQKLTEEAKRAKANNDFRLEEEISRRAFEIEKAKANWTHGENLAEINRKAAANIELARIDRDKIRDQNTAEYRLKDKEYQEKRLKLEGDRYEETKRHDKEIERLRELEVSAKAKGAAGEMPKDTKTRDEHRFRHVATENLKDILKDLQDPEIRKLIGPQNQYLPDVILNLSDKYPQLAQKLARFQSNEFLIGGKSLTQSEQRILGPIYNWRGLTAKALEDNLKEATREMSYQQGVLEEGYPGLKEMTKRYSTASGSTAAPSATSSSGAQKVMPTGAKLQAYANEHFGKDAKKAEEYLRSQGYK